MLSVGVTKTKMFTDELYGATTGCVTIVNNKKKNESYSELAELKLHRHFAPSAKAIVAVFWFLFAS